MRLPIRLWRRDDGATAVEMALVVLAVCFFMLGVVEFGRLYWSWNTVQLAAQQGARYAMVQSSNPELNNTCSTTISSCTSSPQTLQQCTIDQTKAALIAFSTASVTVTATCAGSSPTTMTVTASYPFGFVARGLFPYGTLTLTGTAIVPLM